MYAKFFSSFKNPYPNSPLKDTSCHLSGTLMEGHVLRQGLKIIQATPVSLVLGLPVCAMMPSINLKVVKTCLCCAHNKLGIKTIYICICICIFKVYNLRKFRWTHMHTRSLLQLRPHTYLQAKVQHPCGTSFPSPTSLSCKQFDIPVTTDWSA